MAPPGFRQRVNDADVARVGVQRRPARHVDAVLAGQQRRRQGVTDVDLVALADRPDARVLGHRAHKARQGVAEQDHPGVGAQPLHVAGDGQMVRDLPAGVHEPARPAVLAIGLPQPVAHGNLPVEPPQRFPRRDLDGDDHLRGPGQRLGPLRAGADGQLRVPGVAHALRHARSAVQGRFVQVDQRQFAAT